MLSILMSCERGHKQFTRLSPKKTGITFRNTVQETEEFNHFAYSYLYNGAGVAIGDINNDCSPINPLTGQAYFTIDYRGWGGGWATGNCLRFNLHSASHPVDLVRAVQPSDPTGQSDCVELLLVGNVDA